MAEELLAPIDEAGMPLPILPREHSLKTDKHHHFHPRRSPEFRGDGGKAVRNARTQRVDYHDHHDEYHGYYSGPQLPQTRAEKFYTVIMAAAGYVPAQAISFQSADGPELVDLSEEQRSQLWHSDLRFGSLSIVRKFVTKYTLDQELDVGRRTVKEFLRTKDDTKRTYLGHLLLAKALETATEPIAPIYRQAWEQGLINPESPPGPRDLAVGLLGGPNLREQLFVPLLDRLAAV